MSLALSVEKITGTGRSTKDMKKTNMWISLCMILFISACTSQGQDIDVSGTWAGVTTVPGASQPDQLNLDIVKEGNKLVGTISDSMSVVAYGKCKGMYIKNDILTFAFDVTDGHDVFPAQVKLTIDANTMTGTWSTPDGEGAEITLQRKK